jgi:hypothetical protein
VQQEASIASASDETLEGVQTRSSGHIRESRALFHNAFTPFLHAGTIYSEGKTMEILFLFLSIIAILVMLYALYSSFALKNKVPGGKVKETWGVLNGLIVMFTIGYLTTPFFRMLPPESKISWSA